MPRPDLCDLTDEYDYEVWSECSMDLTPSSPRSIPANDKILITVVPKMTRHDGLGRLGYLTPELRLMIWRLVAAKQDILIGASDEIVDDRVRETLSKRRARYPTDNIALVHTSKAIK